jgi:hypothetical protein
MSDYISRQIRRLANVEVRLPSEVVDARRTPRWSGSPSEAASRRARRPSPPASCSRRRRHPHTEWLEAWCSATAAASCAPAATSSSAGAAARPPRQFDTTCPRLRPATRASAPQARGVRVGRTGAKTSCRVPGRLPRRRRRARGAGRLRRTTVPPASVFAATRLGAARRARSSALSAPRAGGRRAACWLDPEELCAEHAPGVPCAAQSYLVRDAAPASTRCARTSGTRRPRRALGVAGMPPRRRGGPLRDRRRPARAPPRRRRSTRAIVARGSLDALPARRGDGCTPRAALDAGRGSRARPRREARDRGRTERASAGTLASCRSGTHMKERRDVVQAQQPAGR